MKITKATILIRSHHTDSVSLFTDFPSPVPFVTDHKLIVTFEAQKDTGADYVRKNFGIEPEVIIMDSNA